MDGGSAATALRRRGIQPPDDRRRHPGAGRRWKADKTVRQSCRYKPPEIILHLSHEHDQVDGFCGTLQTHATAQEFLKVDLAAVVCVEHVKQTSCLRDVQVDGLKEVSHRSRLHVALDLLEGDESLPVLVERPEQVARLAHFPHFVHVLGTLNGLLHEGACDHVHHGDACEGHVDHERETEPRRDAHERLREVVPIHPSCEALE
mmetsp:Transcript_50601/g.133071  ORF Transcript_50601/g.133071 Transcript_50601/m.133071 type:complete len:204 (-) Transcript_50601:880-1491(-)